MAYVNGGYDHRRFESAVPDNFRCAICLNVLKQPMQCVRNEHSFCKPCITRYLEEFQRCPTCMEPLTLQTLRPSRIITGLVSEMKIKCDNVERGCPEIIKFNALKDHVKDCGFVPVKCSNDGCELIVNRKDQPHHERNDCSFRKEKCEVCGKYVAHGRKKLHCYVTRREMDEIREEISFIKEVVMNMRRELTLHMGKTKDQIANVYKLEHQTDMTAKKVQSMKQQPQSFTRFHGSSVDGRSLLLSYRL